MAARRRRTDDGWERPDAPHRLELRRVARELPRSRDGARELARALRVAARARPGTDDLAWFARIEHQRGRLLADRTELSGGRGTTATVRQVTKQASSPPHQAWLLYALARELGARRILEMGTCVGISGSYLAAAVADRCGALRTLEGHLDRAEVARGTFAALGFDDVEVIVGSFRRTLDGVLADDGPFDLAFVDGHHDGDATREYVTRIRAASRPGALLVLDDIAWSEGMAAAWRDLVAQLAGSVTVHLGRVGLVLLGQGDAGLPAPTSASAPA